MMQQETGMRAGTGWIDALARDVRVGVRALARRPAFTVVAVLTLALGIGASVAMFGVLDTALLRALPYREPGRLVVGRTLWPDGSVGSTVSAPDYHDVRERADVFDATGALTPFDVEATITGDGEPERLNARFVSPGFFRLLGVAPALGREFRAEEGEPGLAPTVLISHELWQRRFGRDPALVGSSITLDGTPVTVVGVLPAGFSFFGSADVCMPMVRGGPYGSGRQFHNWLVVARLRDHVTLQQARADVDVIMGRLAATYPASNRDKGMVLTQLADALVERFRSSLLLLGGAVLLVLLIACANVASLLLARGAGRRAEIAMRTALGAGRAHLVRQLLTESALIGIAAGVLGTAIAFALRRAVLGIVPATAGSPDAAAFRPAALLFALGITAITVLLAGLAPALMATRVDPAGDLRDGARGTTASRAWFRSGLVVAQVALSILLLTGAGLLTRSFLTLSSVDPGFRTGGLLTADVSLSPTAYPDPDRRVLFFQELERRARAIPGVEDVAFISRLPIRDWGGNVAAWNTEHPPADASEWRLAYVRTVLPGYFDAMGIRIDRGRDFDASDIAGAQPVMLISEAMARALFPGEDPIGRRVAVDAGPEAPQFEVVGVVGDVRTAGLMNAAGMTMYFPHAQRPTPGMRIAVRHAGGPAAAALRDVLRELDPDVPLAGVRTMDEVISHAVAFPRAITLVLAAFAAVALFLAALGLYGILAFQVTERRREIGIRVALGAGSRNVLTDVIGHGLRLLALGLGFGVPAALLGGRFIASQLFQTTTRDPATFVTVALVLLAAALAASALPAWRALRVDPATALRLE